MSSPASYQLALELNGHASDVRNLCAPSPGIPLLLSASRDGSAIVWGPSSKSPGEWDVMMRAQGPEKRFVSCVGMTRWNGEALLLVGSSSGILSSYILPSPTSSIPPNGQMPEPYHTLVEHKQNLCCMDTSKGGLIATGSWDKLAVIWKDFKAALKIEKHEQAVWSVRFVGEDRILTGSADLKIILHSFDMATSSSSVLQEYTGHTEPIRGLSLKGDGKGFWSCANDGLVNVYAFDQPAPVSSLSGHTSFVYSVTALPDCNGAISSGEDGTMRVWSETDLVQTITHTSNSLWSTACVSSGSGGFYIASSSQDSVIRFFTRDEALMAPASVRERWDHDVSNRQLDKSQIGDVKHSDLPGMEALGREGKKDGQVIMIKNGTTVEAYSWSGPNRTWQQVGTVVDAVGSGRRQLYNGQEYDYVFDVDVSEGMPPLKLPYNASENPYVAAHKFLEKHELPSAYLDQVVEFIHKNTEGVQLGGGDASTYVDPYTGASRYMGGGPSRGASTGGGDPFTGGSAYSSTPAPPAQGILPVTSYQSFKQMNVNAAKGKIAQFNEDVKASSPELAMTDDDERNMTEIYATLSQPGSAKAGFDAGGLINLIIRWPEAQRFPLIDLARCLAAVSPAFATPTIPSDLLGACDWSSPWTATKARETNTLLVLRALANLFLTPGGRKAMCKGAEDVIGALSTRKWEDLGARKMAFATIALNYSVAATSGDLGSGQVSTLLDMVSYVLENEKTDNETIYRASVALGNLLASPKLAGSLQVGKVHQIRGHVLDTASKLGEKRLTDLAAEIANLG